MTLIQFVKKALQRIVTCNQPQLCSIEKSLYGDRKERNTCNYGYVGGKTNLSKDVSQLTDYKSRYSK
jgi:hypothetical protein